MSEGELRTINSTQRVITDGRASVAQLVSFHQNAIDKQNQNLNAVAVVNERAIDAAHELDVSLQSTTYGNYAKSNACSDCPVEVTYFGKRATFRHHCSSQRSDRDRRYSH